MGNVNQFTNAIVVFSLVYAGLELTGLSLGEIGLFLFAVYRLSPLMSQMNTLVYGADGELPHLIRVQSRIDELESMETEDSTHGRSVQRVDEVTFEDVSFSYDDEPVLRDVSFTVARGERVALVGQSGAGKSTIVALLARLQTPDHGQIMADDTPIDEFAVDEWRERIAVVRQDPYIFDGTLQENVTIGNRNATRADVEHACETAQVTEFLSELSDGYKTELGEDGVRLSGGQKQRVAIARALLKPADVLVLDEATSDLDSTIEQDVYRGIRQQDGQYATISIAHRLSTVRESDRIYMLEDGSITGVGTHEVLIQRGDLYAELYETQD
jgi:subfamily B ATP-binding cassette protein MsbA